jgi:hypothetical protein
VDSIVYEREILFSKASRYGRPPLDVSHGGGVFTTQLLESGSAKEQMLFDMNKRVLEGLGMLRGVTHTEYIWSEKENRFFFLETAARVEGAHIADLIAHATGINLWREWAKVEIAGGHAPYAVPDSKDNSGALLVCLSRQEWPDMTAYDAPEVVWRIAKKNHAGLILTSPDEARVNSLLADYTTRFQEDFLAYAPPRDRPVD